MRYHILYVLLCLVCGNQVSAQTHAILLADTTNREKRDSSEVAFLSDSMKSTKAQLDSIEKDYNKQRDSLRDLYISQRSLLMNKLETIHAAPETLKDSLLAKTKLDSVRHSLKTLEDRSDGL